MSEAVRGSIYFVGRSVWKHPWTSSSSSRVSLSGSHPGMRNYSVITAHTHTRTQNCWTIWGKNVPTDFVCRFSF